MEAEFSEITLALEYQQHYEEVTYWGLLKSSSMRKRLAYGLGAMAFAQLCGQQALLYLRDPPVRQPGLLRGRWGMNLNIKTSSIQLVACLVSWFCAEKLGRRKLFLWALGVTTVSYVVSGALTDAYPNEINRGANIVYVVFIFIIQC